jgi:hypothetical protein
MRHCAFRYFAAIRQRCLTPLFLLRACASVQRVRAEARVRVSAAQIFAARCAAAAGEVRVRRSAAKQKSSRHAKERRRYGGSLLPRTSRDARTRVKPVRCLKREYARATHPPQNEHRRKKRRKVCAQRGRGKSRCSSSEVRVEARAHAACEQR